MSEQKKAVENKEVGGPKKAVPSTDKKDVSSVPKKKEDTTYIMCVGHLSWGFRGRNHFFVDDKPLISKKVLGKYAPILDVWIHKGWIKEGSYK